MKIVAVILIFISLFVAWAGAASESSDMHKSLGLGFSLPTFERTGWSWFLHSNIPILPVISLSPEVALGYWNMVTADSRDLTPDGSNRQSWEQHQNLDTQYAVLALRGYPLTRWVMRLSPYVMTGGGYSHTLYKDRFSFWGTYNNMSDWAKKAYTQRESNHGLWMAGVGLDMPLNKTWSLNYEYRWQYIPGFIGDKNKIKTDGLGTAGTLTTESFENSRLQYPITISVEVRPW